MAHGTARPMGRGSRSSPDTPRPGRRASARPGAEAREPWSSGATGPSSRSSTSGEGAAHEKRTAAEGSGAAPVEPDYRQIVEHAGDIIYTLDLAGRFTYANRAAAVTVGHPADRVDELLGTHFLDWLTPDSRTVALEHFQQGIQGAEITPFFEVQAIRLDGGIVDLEVRAGPLRRDGRLVGRQGVSRDITELKRLQAETLRASERLRLIEERTRSALALYQRVAQLASSSAVSLEDEAAALREMEDALTTTTGARLGLSQGDLRLIRLVARGKTNREIAAEVHLSPNTVKDHLRRIMDVLRTPTRVELVLRADREGLLES